MTAPHEVPRIEPGQTIVPSTGPPGTGSPSSWPGVAPAAVQQQDPQTLLLAEALSIVREARAGKYGPVTTAIIAAVVSSTLVSVGFWGYHTVSGGRATTHRLDEQDDVVDKRLDAQDARISRIERQQDRILLGVEVIADKVGARVPSGLGDTP